MFGTTVLGQGVHKNLLARPAMWLLNAIGLFNNRQDNARDLAHFLRENFQVLEFYVVGVVAVFSVKRKHARPDLS
jgi:hypothetical protein